jgi:hypothetical protein
MKMKGFERNILEFFIKSIIIYIECPLESLELYDSWV